MMFNEHLPIIVLSVVLGIAIMWLYRDLQSLKSEIKRGPPQFAASARPVRPGKPAIKDSKNVRFAEEEEDDEEAEGDEDEDFDELPGEME